MLSLFLLTAPSVRPQSFRSKMRGKQTAHWTIASVLFWVKDKLQISSFSRKVRRSVWGCFPSAYSHTSHIHSKCKLFFAGCHCSSGFDCIGSLINAVAAEYKGGSLCTSMWTLGGSIWLFISYRMDTMKASPVWYNPIQYQLRPQKLI